MIGIADFLIQTINGQIRHDFSFGLVQAIEYQNWLNKGSHDYHLADMDDMLEYDATEFIPCGSIQFIQKFLATYHDKHTIKPINIPSIIGSIEYTKRICWNMHKNHIKLIKKSFVKSNNELKGFADIISQDEISALPDGNYLVSDVIDIESEWRTFVYEDKLVGLQNYLGDFTMFPDIDMIQLMIKDYIGSPPAYTLDVGINENDGTFLIECHNFYSCGLYGFNKENILPQMFIRSFKHLANKGY